MLKILSKVVAIVKETIKKDKDNCSCICLGGITDLLLERGSFQLLQVMKRYKEKLLVIEQRHLEAVKQLIPVAQQSHLLSLVKKEL
jgi:aspartokinase/homoserine dehydrogenase 1